MRAALLPVLCAVRADAACTCEKEYPYCYSKDHKCYNPTTQKASSRDCIKYGRGDCTS
eukprot:gene8749-4961_t